MSRSCIDGVFSPALSEHISLNGILILNQAKNYHEVDIKGNCEYPGSCNSLLIT